MPNWAKLLLGLIAAYVIYDVGVGWQWNKTGRCFLPAQPAPSPTGRFEAELLVCGQSAESLNVTVSLKTIGDRGKGSWGVDVFSANTPIDAATFARMPGDHTASVSGHIQMAWLDGSQFEISFPAGTRSRGYDSYNGISVSYKKRPQ
jgi:hypothetical protein